MSLLADRINFIACYNVKTLLYLKKRQLAERRRRNSLDIYRILQPLNMPVSTRYGHTSVILMPSFSEALISWLSDSWKPMAPNLLAQ